MRGYKLMEDKMNYSKLNVDAVTVRMRQYEEVLAAPEFVQLDSCDVCDTVSTDCLKCLFYTWDEDEDCMDTDTQLGAACETKKAQRGQQQFLLSQMAKNGWEFDYE